jgi:hypothetical protein
MCYTQEEASVCRLPLGDVRNIFSIIDTRDLISLVGIGQILDVIGTCIGQKAEDVGKAINRLMD